MKRFVHPNSLRRLTLAILAAALVATSVVVPRSAASATAPPTASQTLAQQIVNSGMLSGNPEPMAQIRGYANGALFSHVVGGQVRDCLIDPVILQALKTTIVDRKFSLYVASLNRFCTGELSSIGTSSYHWRSGGGHAVDISRVNGVPSTGATAQDLALINSMFTALPAPAGLGQYQCRSPLSVPAQWTQFEDSCDHNHFEYRGGVGGLAPNGPFDLNGDMKSDLLGVRDDGYLVEYLSYGPTGAVALTGNTLGNGWETTSAIVHGDFNGDGAGDLLQTRTDGRLFYYSGDASSHYSGLQVGSGWTSAYSLLTGGVDFTGDGRPDLVTRGPDAALYAYPGLGNGWFGGRVQIGNGWSGMTALVAGDFDNNGRGDLIARDVNGDLWAYFGLSTGFTAPRKIGWGWNIFSTITGAGDYDGDGNADIIGRNGTDQTLWLYRGTGSGTIGSYQQIGNGWGGFRFIS
ncbi:FG-GAP repeat domain-containing protein [Microbacterium azadirachtae]|uniref:FG-GAP repeat domain-containing protein n=1 Tax=Microbacterium azadirachtae TaxID=582680 RepID=UPI000884834E|nr:VCBS repeat-containing protein [Microbacterium azadirachtae]SDL17208.1 Repeat domain-containing protein [Microbacterium azadirachtae]SEF47294.1 Repeat domain-containing protein [Microbacterium azadirachtae]SEF47298.1 Repeat domain-containing protein [Microbacterium azadirachtae]